MAENVPVFQNRRLLIVAAALGIIVAVVYNFHIAQVREAAQGKKASVLRVLRDISPGEEIKTADLEQVEVAAEVVNSLQNPIGTLTEFTAYERRIANQSIQKGQYLLWGHISGTSFAGRPSAGISRDMKSYTLAIDPQKSPGELLSRGDHVDIIGVFSIGAKPPQSYLVLRGVRVLTVAGKAAREGSSGKPRVDEGLASFRTIDIEVSDDTALKMRNLETHMVGYFTLGVRNPTENFPPNPEINPELKDLYKATPGGPAKGN